MRMPVLDGRAVHEIMRQKQARWRWSFSPGMAIVPMAVGANETWRGRFCKTGVSRAASGSIRTCLAGLGSGVLATRDHLLLSTTYAKRTGTGASGSKGLMNREIADAMNIAVRTVEVHRARVMEKCRQEVLLSL